MAFESEQKVVCDAVVEVRKGEFNLFSKLSALDVCIQFRVCGFYFFKTNNSD